MKAILLESFVLPKAEYLNKLPHTTMYLGQIKNNKTGSEDAKDMQKLITFLPSQHRFLFLFFFNTDNVLSDKQAEYNANSD